MKGKIVQIKNNLLYWNAICKPWSHISCVKWNIVDFHEMHTHTHRQFDTFRPILTIGRYRWYIYIYFSFPLFVLNCAIEFHWIDIISCKHCIFICQKHFHHYFITWIKNETEKNFVFNQRSSLILKSYEKQKQKELAPEQEIKMQYRSRKKKHESWDLC